MASSSAASVLTSPALPAQPPARPPITETTRLGLNEKANPLLKILRSQEAQAKTLEELQGVLAALLKDRELSLTTIRELRSEISKLQTIIQLLVKEDRLEQKSTANPGISINASPLGLPNNNIQLSKNTLKIGIIAFSIIFCALAYFWKSSAS